MICACPHVSGEIAIGYMLNGQVDTCFSEEQSVEAILVDRRTTLFSKLPVHLSSSSVCMCKCIACMYLYVVESGQERFCSPVHTCPCVRLAYIGVDLQKTPALSVIFQALRIDGPFRNTPLSYARTIFIDRDAKLE